MFEMHNHRTTKVKLHTYIMVNYHFHNLYVYARACVYVLCGIFSMYVYMFVCCLDYCPCLISGRVLRGLWEMRGSSCRCVASLSGFVLVPFSSKNGAVREEMKTRCE